MRDGDLRHVEVLPHGNPAREKLFSKVARRGRKPAPSGAVEGTLQRARGSRAINSGILASDGPRPGTDISILTRRR
jgi:hypothetical protein